MTRFGFVDLAPKIPIFSVELPFTMNEYEQLRAENIRRNQEILRQMGLLSSPLIKPTTTTSSTSTTIKPIKPIKPNNPIISKITSIIKPFILFQCNQCWRILCDNRVAIGDLVFVSVSNVQIDDSFLNVNENGCLFNDVDCRCGANVGRFYVATTPQLDSLRFMFALSRSALYSYTIQNHQNILSANLQSKTAQMISETRSSMVRLMQLDDDLEMMSAANIFYADSSTYESFSDDLQFGLD
jgi:hypothetical protein